MRSSFSQVRSQTGIAAGSENRNGAWSWNDYGLASGGERSALIGYGPDYADMYLRVGAYILRIIKGEKPANLPVQEPTKFPLLINAKSAKAIGVSFPAALIVAADEVID